MIDHQLIIGLKKLIIILKFIIKFIKLKFKNKNNKNLMSIFIFYLYRLKKFEKLDN